MTGDTDTGVDQALLNVDGYEHLKKKHEKALKENHFLGGLLIGLAAGLLWEAIRR